MAKKAATKRVGKIPAVATERQNFRAMAGERGGTGVENFDGSFAARITSANVRKLEAEASILESQAARAKAASGPSGGKHNALSPEGLKRMAHAHNLKAKEHAQYARNVAIATLEATARRAKHEACALMHAETCEILNAEANEVLEHFKGKKG